MSLSVYKKFKGVLGCYFILWATILGFLSVTLLWVVTLPLGRFQTPKRWRQKPFELFAEIVLFATNWCAPASFYVYLDEAGLRKASSGEVWTLSRISQAFGLDEGKARGLEEDCRTREIVMSNHQIYTDWVYLVGFLHALGRASSVKIVLKWGLQLVPFVGLGMKLLNFVFVKRNWAVDRVKFFRRIRRIGAFGLPYSLVIFPEGTTLNPTAIAKGQAYAKVNGLPVLKHVLVPRKTGLEAAINALRQVEDPSCGEALQGVLDLTIGYSGLKATQIPEEHYGIGSMLFSSHAPKEVHILPSCIPLKDIPEDSEKFGQWLNARFKRKEELLASFFAEGRFPGYQARPVTIVPRNALWRLLLMLFCVHALLAYLFFFPRK